MTFRYTAGDRVALCAGALAVLVEVGIDDPLVDELWAVAARPGAHLAEVLEVLVATGLRAVGGFALAEGRSDGVRVVVRGSLTAVAPDGTAVRGEGLWSERDLPSRSVRLGAADPRGAELPLLGGIVLADSVSLLGDAGAAADEVGPAASGKAEAETQPVRPPPGPVPVGPATPLPGSPPVPAFPAETMVEAGSVEDAIATQVLPSSSGPPPSASGTGTTGREAVTAPLVRAVRCPRGHVSPAGASRCRTCGDTITDQRPVEVSRPPLGVLRLPDGEEVLLDRNVLLGRNPRPPEGYGTAPAHLVRVLDPNRDVSGLHLAVRLDGWTVFVRDLASTNGTEVVAPDGGAVELRPNDDWPIEPGARILLAGTYEIRYDL